jgi:hypothetical protein
MTLSGDGTITGLAAGGLPDGSVTQAEIATGVAGKGPAFSAYASAAQSITTSTFTKVAINTELFDTNNNFDSTTNYRFTPTVEGYYQVNGTVRMSATASSITQTIAALYKNGSVYARGSDNVVSVATTLAATAGTFNEIIYMNGSTDYIELYGFVTGTSPSFNFTNANITSRFSASMVRSA